MNTPKTLILIAAWLLSVLIAYLLGSGLQTSPAATREGATGSTAAEDRTKLETSAHRTIEAVLESELVSDGPEAAPTSDTIRSELAVALAGPQNTPQAASQIRQLLSELAVTHPEEALALAGQIESLRAKEGAQLEILETWARTDPNAALAWAETALVQLPSSMRNAQLRAIYRGYAMLNPKAALQAASQLGDSTATERRLKSNLMGEVIETQIENGDLVAAKQSIELMENGDLKNDMLREMIDEWASYDPLAAAAYVESLGPDADNAIKMELVREWAEVNPAAAAAWLETLDQNDPTISRAASSIIREWARYDLTASAEWLNSLPASSELDRAVASYTFRAVQEDPATAMTWAESVTSDRMKGYLQQRVAGAWQETDPEGFQQYLDNSELSDKAKEKLLQSNSWESGRGPSSGRP
ncbi:MAG: hypothetical protein ACPGKS_06590 [Coraliomargarita sp.]